MVVGASLAGARSAEALREAGFTGHLTVLGAETHRPYQRPPLSKQFLTGAWEAERLRLRLAPFEATWRLGVRATALDLAGRALTLDDGERLPFDGLVLATGATPRLLGDDDPLAGVFSLRTVEDAASLRAELVDQPRRPVVVVGAGFIGCEVASAALELGHEVTIVEPLDTPLGRVLGPVVGAVVAEALRARGANLFLGRGVRALEGAAGSLQAVLLDSGERLPAAVAVVGLGVRPATAWLEASGLDLADGITCDATGAALSADGSVAGPVVAAGDAARWHQPLLGEHVRLEHWDAAIRQARVAAQRLLHGPEVPPLGDIPFFWSDQGPLRIQLYGYPRGSDDVVVVEEEGESAPGVPRLVAAYGRGGRTTAVLGIGMARRLVAWREVVAAGAAFPPPAP